MAEKNIRIRDSGVGSGKVELDGRDISRYVQGIDIQIRAGEPTRVVLYLPPLEYDVGVIAAAELISCMQQTDNQLINILKREYGDKTVPLTPPESE